MESSKSPVYGFLKQPSMVDFKGHLAAVFFTAGCNFRCGFCHNASLMGAPREGLPWQRLREVCGEFRDNWVDAAVITGGEPTLNPDLAELVTFFKDFGWAVKLDTNGSRPRTVEKCLPHVDYLAMDIKAGLSGYPALTGYAQTENIKESVSLIMNQARDYEFRTTVIDNFHTEQQMLEIGELIRGARRYIMQPFVPREDLPDPALAATPRTPADRLHKLETLVSDFATEVLVRGN